MTPERFVESLCAALEDRRDPEAAVAMAAYMKNQFPFLGLKRPDWEPLAAGSFASAPSDEAWLHAAALLLWAQPEREFVYIGAQLLKKKRKFLTPATLPLLEELIPQSAWWDSVDALAGHVLGPLVLCVPELQTEMDRWSVHENHWIRRAAILHQLGHKSHTDKARLFAYCCASAAESDFFLRKAIGWALRTYGATNPDAVRAFVAENREALSPLSVREALKHL